MKCVHINIRKACFILLSLMTQYSHMLDNQMDLDPKYNIKDSPTENQADDKIWRCNSKETSCSDLIPSCFTCNLTNKCVYGESTPTKCEVVALAQCKGERAFEKTLLCQYCYQTEPWQHSCELKADCHSVLRSKSVYQTNCTVHDDIICLGHRKFNKNVRCNWTRGYRWSTTLAISIGLGGFGADRFYLGHWQEGIGKLFSFGGLGVWTLIDVILIALHYLGPADGSLYI